MNVPAAVILAAAPLLIAPLAVFSPEQVQKWFEWGGYFMLFGLLFACGLGLPLPEDIPLLLGGYFVALGQMNIVWVGVLAWSGIIGGDCVLYWLSRRYGLNITRLPMIGGHVTKERILWAETKFQRWGVWVVAVCRLFAGVRGAMVIAAGVVRFNFLKFVVADGLAALVSGGLFVWLGYLAGKTLGGIGEIRQKIKHYEHYVVIGLVAAAALLVAYIVWRRRTHKTLSEEAVEKIEEAVVKIEHLHEEAKAHAHGDAAAAANPPAPPADTTPQPDAPGAPERRREHDSVTP